MSTADKIRAAGGTQRVYELSVERCAYSERGPGMGNGGGGLNGGPNSAEQALKATRTSDGQRIRPFQSARDYYRNVRPHTGKREWQEGEDRSGYDMSRALSAIHRHTARFSKDSRRGKVRATCAKYLRELGRADVDAGAAASAESYWLNLQGEAEFFAGVTTGNRDEAAHFAQAIREFIGTV